MNNPLGGKIYFIGIGGSGMSGLARILKAYSAKVSGSDKINSSTIANLKKMDINIKIGHAINNIPKKTDTVIYSPAIEQNNIELQEARNRKLKIYSYTQAVGFLTVAMRTICVCGTHGKTTTTAMAATAFIRAKKDPTVLLGTSLKELQNSNARNSCSLTATPRLAGTKIWPGSKKNNLQKSFFILEACEYKRGFLSYNPEIIVITNIETDHLDYFKNLQDYIKAFREFAKKVPKNGLIIANIDDANVRKTLQNLDNHIVWYGTAQNADYCLKKNRIYKGGRVIAYLTLKIPGQHNLLNATAVLALADSLKLPLKQVTTALKQYEGASRRFETIGKLEKTIVMSDYGHHPTEIIATLKAVREKFGKKAKILCIFQPHQYSRTHKLLNAFARAFNNADEVVIPNIFRVRDTSTDVQKISTTKLVQKIAKFHHNVRSGHGFKKTIQYIQNKAKKYDVILVMGAGDVDEIARELAHSPLNHKFTHKQKLQPLPYRPISHILK